ncbi:Protein NRT1/ PTR FAMILY 8.4 [Symbiodinium microadriaticum]|uniref:Protein NRT1/ PTR FAMILY 8.4 n=1 Tax=Symbiodinium microadriaticum TaxID=2951 RepID=A0A1Q9ENC2_SYMMI|nr:Protein NRT1/ PTR FAMILY 8.4 [Symbiodinium microadriaticum]
MVFPGKVTDKELANMAGNTLHVQIVAIRDAGFHPFADMIRILAHRGTLIAPFELEDEDDGEEELVEPPKRTNKLFTVCSFILVVEMCERYAKLYPGFFGALAGEGHYVGEWPSTGGLRIPDLMESSFGVPLYLCPGLVVRLGAFVFVALGCLAAVRTPEAGGRRPCTGAIKPNVMNFGADQYDTQDPEEEVQQKAFFSYFYLTINVGVVFAMGFTVTRQYRSTAATTTITSYNSMSISRDGIDVSRVGALGAWDGSMGNRQPPQGSLAGTSQRTGLEAGYSQPFSSEHKPGNNITWLPVPYVSGL